MAIQKSDLNRRTVLKSIGTGVLGATVGAGLTWPQLVQAKTSPATPGPGRRKASYQKLTEPAQVSLVKGNDRREIVYQALKKLEDPIISSIGNKRILIKPNFVVTNTELCATHVDAIRATSTF